jgi:sugar phosphate isomerase/epimerase
MFYTGFADEAGNSIDTQIKATKELGWNNIESRSLEGSNLAYMSEDIFETVFQKLQTAGIKINCYGSAIANWAKDPRKDEDFETSRDELLKVIPRLQKLGTKMLRGMSFAIVKDEKPDSPEIEKQVFKKVNELVRICEDAGIVYGHENCMNYGGMSWVHTLKLLDNVKSDNFRLILDTGNTVGTYDYSKPMPWKKQSTWEFYCNIKEFICYVHIKDCIYIKETDGLFSDRKHTYPGEGHGDLRMVVKDLLKTGYDGGFSIEPHMDVIFDAPGITSKEDAQYKTYVEYGKRFMMMFDEIKKN